MSRDARDVRTVSTRMNSEDLEELYRLRAALEVASEHDVSLRRELMRLLGRHAPAGVRLTEAQAIRWAIRRALRTIA